MIFLRSIPWDLAYLRSSLQVATLVAGDWLDRHVVMLAEVGAILIDQGYQLQETSDQHPLAWPHFIDSKGSEIDQGQIHALCQQVGWRLKRFPGRTKEIEGRPYISFEDYCSWRARKVKGNLRSSVSAGFLTASWNTWLDTKSAKRRLSGVPVDRLQCYVEEHDYLVCPDGGEGRLKRRALLLSVICKTESTRTRQEETFCKDIAGMLLTKLYVFRQAVTTISRRYYDGEEVLFPDLVRSLADLIKYSEELVAKFNDEIAGKPEDKMDLAAFQKGDGEMVMQQVSDLVNMAKADALDAMGESRAATELVERHL